MNFNIYKNIKKQGDLVFLCLILFFGLLLNKTTITEGFTHRCTKIKRKRTERKRRDMKFEVSEKGQQYINGWQFERVTGPECKPKKLKLRYRKGDEIIKEKTLDDIINTIKNKEGIKEPNRKQSRAPTQDEAIMIIVKMIGIPFGIVVSLLVLFYFRKSILFSFFSLFSRLFLRKKIKKTKKRQSIPFNSRTITYNNTKIPVLNQQKSIIPTSIPNQKSIIPKSITKSIPNQKSITKSIISKSIPKFKF